MVANRLRTLDPNASPAALFGAELRALRLRRGIALAGLGRLVHVSGDLLGKIEKADRRPQSDLIDRLDTALEADGRLRGLGAALSADYSGVDGGTLDAAGRPVLSAETALPVLRAVVESARAEDHVMRALDEVGVLVAYAEAGEPVERQLNRDARVGLRTAIAEAYQLAGWMCFDRGRPARGEGLLEQSRVWAERAGDPALSAFVLGPNLSFLATYGGNAALGVERAYGAIGWAKRSGNQRLTSFAMSIAASAHARLGETALCLDLLDQARHELSGHTSDAPDAGWLSVFDEAALEGHRGSCLLDLGRPGQALHPLDAQDRSAQSRFVRNRVIWRLDRIDALLALSETEQACVELDALLEWDSVSVGELTRRVLGRFRAIELRLRSVPAAHRAPRVEQTLERVRWVSVAGG